MEAKEQTHYLELQKFRTQHRSIILPMDFYRFYPHTQKVSAEEEKRLVIVKDKVEDLVKDLHLILGDTRTTAFMNTVNRFSKFQISRG